MIESVAWIYLLCAIGFIYALRGLSHPQTARKGALSGVIAMALAIGATMMLPNVTRYSPIIVAMIGGGIIGAVIAWKIDMKALPQLVAAFHSLVGLAAVCVALAAYDDPAAYGIGIRGSISPVAMVEMSLGAAIGAVTFTGSLVAFAKLQGLVGGSPTIFFAQHWFNLAMGIAMVGLIVLFALFGREDALWGIILLSLILGVTLVIPIGGADMPVVVSMLNSYSGWATVGIGFTLQQNLLIIVGALVGSSGAILSYIMCKGMNRSFWRVILGGFGAEEGQVSAAAGERNVKSGAAADAAFILSNASSVVIVPGYGMAVAQAQHAIAEMANILKKRDIRIRYAIHPVAGRMPGHMNVLLAEANIPYDDVVELDNINNDFASTDVAFVIGANDITNPAAKNDPQSPIYGMPILDVEKASTVLFSKRSLASGYAGIDNELFFQESTMMLFGDARKMVEGIIKSLA